MARVREQRTLRPANPGIRRESYPYPLSGITFCAHCERLAVENNDPRLRSRLGGKGAGKSSRDVPRYRHKRGVRCGTKRQSVHCDIYEADFARLIQLLTLKPEAIDAMTELAIRADTSHYGDDLDLQRQKEEAITLCKRRIDCCSSVQRRCDRSRRVPPDSGE